MPMKVFVFILFFLPVCCLSQVENYISERVIVGGIDEPGNASVTYDKVVISINQNDKNITIQYVGQGPLQTYPYYDLEYRNGAVCYFLKRNLMNFVSVLLTDTNSGKNLTFMFEEPINTVFIYGPLKKM